MGKSPCCDKSKVKRGSWSPDEDAILKNYIHNHGIVGNWIALPQRAGLQRCGKSCRLRWLNYLRPNLKHGAFTQDEQNIISTLYTKVGSRWSVIASHLPGRTDNDVKNYWNTKMKKKLMPANSNTKADSIVAATTTAATATVTATPTKTLDKTTNIQASKDLLALPPTFPMLFSLYDDFTLPRFVLEGQTSNCSSGSFSPSHQESSIFRPFSLGVDDNGILMDDFSSYEVMSGVWCQEEEGIGADDNADLFSIFNDHSEGQGVSQNQ